MTDGVFSQAFVYLARRGRSPCPIAKRLGLGAVLGYLLAGVAIGPFGAGASSAARAQDVMHFAEFGVVMMLFLVGLELEPVAALAAARPDPRARRRAGASAPPR